MENNIDRLCVINLVLLCVLFFLAAILNSEIYGLSVIFISIITIVLWLMMLHDKNFRCPMIFCILNTLGFLCILDYIIDVNKHGTFSESIAFYVLFSQIAFFFVFFIKHWIESNRG